MVYELKRVTGFSGRKVVGMAGVLDSARFQLFIARELGVSVKDVRPMVLGGHGDTMVPVTSACTSTRPRAAAHRGRQARAIVDRTRNGGGEIVKLMGTSAFYAPASAAVTMAESYSRISSAWSRAPPTSKASTATATLHGRARGHRRGRRREGREHRPVADEKAMLEKSASACASSSRRRRSCEDPRVQGKELLRKYGVPVPKGTPVFSVDEAEAAAKAIIAETGGEVVVVKAQIHAVVAARRRRQGRQGAAAARERRRRSSACSS